MSAEHRSTDQRLRCAACKSKEVGPADLCFGCHKTICSNCCGPLGHHGDGPHALNVKEHVRWENNMAKKRAAAAKAAPEPAKKEEPIVCEWTKTDPLVPVPAPLQFSPRELNYLDTLLTVELSVVKPENINKTMRETHYKIRAEFKKWWDSLEKTGEGTWTIKTAFTVPASTP